eukprot:scaffold58749_cov19-Prasinocladus_malaysianus.AAC.1
MDVFHIWTSIYVHKHGRAHEVYKHFALPVVQRSVAPVAKPSLCSYLGSRNPQLLMRDCPLVIIVETHRCSRLMKRFEVMATFDAWAKKYESSSHGGLSYTLDTKCSVFGSMPASPSMRAFESANSPALLCACISDLTGIARDTVNAP